VLPRWLGLAAVLAAFPILSGCSAGAAPDSAEATGGSLTVYSSLPLQGPEGPVSEQIVGGEKLALAQAGAHAGPYKIGYVSLDDADPKTGIWNPGITAGNAKRAAQDPSTIAYLGDFDSAATAISLPLINGAGVLQVSPSSPYVGLTSSLDAGQDEPGRFYPSGQQTFGRVLPGDPSEAQAQLQLMRSLGIKSVYVLDDMDPFASALATIVAGKAQAAGIHVPAHESISTAPEGSFEKLVETISASGAQAVFMAGEGNASSARLWRELHRADPRLVLLADSGMANSAFTSHLGAAASKTYLTTPLLSSASYPPEAQRVLGAYRRAFGSSAGPWALAGYAAMRMVLDAIDAAGHDATDRRTVIARLLGAPQRESVLGPMSIRSNGNSTLSRYGVDTVSSNGRPTFQRALSLPASTEAAG
jgi:branched-chain amino acid transport system substrate-binding protein